jgi:intracellular multiplication protein IcmB
MLSFISNGLASLSLLLKQALPAYCDLETSHRDAFVTNSGNYVTWLRVDGMQRNAA